MHWACRGFVLDGLGMRLDMLASPQSLICLSG